MNWMRMDEVQPKAELRYARRSTRGSAIAEYAIIVALISIIAVFALLRLSTTVQTIFEDVGETLSSNLEAATEDPSSFLAGGGGAPMLMTISRSDGQPASFTFVAYGSGEIDWGDGTTTAITTAQTEYPTHTYAGPGPYQVSFTGSLLSYGAETDKCEGIDASVNRDLVSVDDFGETGVRSLHCAFYEADNLASLAPVPASVTDLSRMLVLSDAHPTGLDAWDVSNVTDFNHMFARMTTLNPPVAGWQMTSAKNLHGMFHLTSLDRDLSSWDVSTVENMSGLFGFMDYNYDISNWDVSNVQIFDQMFRGNDTFDQPIGQWQTSSATSMRQMFRHADAFDQDLRGWDVSKVTDFEYMFENTQATDLGLRFWDMSSAETLRHMLHASRLTEDLSGWNVSNVSDFKSTFAFSEINADLSAWDVSSALTMEGMFNYADNYNQDLSSWTAKLSSDFCAAPDSYTNFARHSASWTLPKPDFEAACGP